VITPWLKPITVQAFAGEMVSLYRQAVEQGLAKKDISALAEVIR
jgi:hypothetical protein